MDVNAGEIIKGLKTVNEIGDIIFENVLKVASGEKSKSEELGHKEFILTYKKFDITGSPQKIESIGPSCLS